MSVGTRIAAFAGGLLVVFAVAAGIGSLADPAETETVAGHGETTHQDERPGETLKEERMNGHGGHEGGESRPAGLAISEGGYTLRLSDPFREEGERGELRFRVTGPAGEPVTGFDELHERRMHLILVRRDGTGFRHLHPEMDEAGTWTVPVELTEAGVHRVFADFSVHGEQHTLAADLFVSGGDFEARAFPPDERLAETDGYEVRLTADEPVAGRPASLAFDVSRDGEAVEDLGPYLGARGHLVALREGDLAFLHVHPEDAPGDGSGHGADGHTHGAEGPGADRIAFGATFPSAGRYRLYLQFRHDGAVRTAEFTVSVPR